MKGSYQESIVDEKSQDFEEDMYWYEIKVTKSTTDDKGIEKYITTKYLVEGEDLEDAMEVMKSYMNFQGEKADSWWFTSIQETLIQEVILSDIAIQ